MLDIQVKRGALTLALVLSATLVFMRAAMAELPPQYTVWQNFAAITAQTSIPEQLGVVDRIERTQQGYRIFGSNCWIDAVISRESPKGPNGQPMVGPSRVSAVTLGEKKCK